MTVTDKAVGVLNLFYTSLQNSPAKASTTRYRELDALAGGLSFFNIGRTAAMADSLVHALENVHIGASNEADTFIDDILELQRPRKRAKQDQEELKRSLEEKYLTPSNTFSPEWLNKLQQSVCSKYSTEK